jgi:hypothetical protein
MLVVISCPQCGHLGRVPEGRIGHKVRCKGCGGTFRPEAALAQPAPESLRQAKERATAAPSRKRREGTAAEKQPKSGWFAVFTRPAVIDGAISGAIGGVLTGILMGAINGGLSRHASGGAIAGVIGGGLNGAIVGFLCGAPLGGILGLLASYFQGEAAGSSRSRALLTGIIAGAAVTALVARGSPWMIALGILPGALGSGFWSLLQNWEQAADKPFVSGFQVEEEASSEASPSESKEASSEDFQSWGAYDDEKA